MWRRGTGRAFPDLVAEAEGRCQREERGYGEERRAFLEGLGENAAVPPGDGGVGGAESLGCGKELVRGLGFAGGLQKVTHLKLEFRSCTSPVEVEDSNLESLGGWSLGRS